MDSVTTTPEPVNDARPFDRVEQLMHLIRLTGPRSIFLQEFPTKRHLTVDGTLNAIQGALAQIEKPTSEAIFYGFNPIKPGARGAPCNDDIERRTHLFLDVDHPEKHTGLSATADGKAAAFAACNEIIAYLLFDGWPAPTKIDSGNGPHAYWHIDIPNDASSAALVKSWLQALQDMFGPLVDIANADARRLGRVPGTWNRRGEHSAERPHRPCLFLEAGEERIVTATMIQAAIHKINAELAEQRARATAQENMPGTDFNRHATWGEILEPHGWKEDKPGHWTRPGKDTGTSATTNYCKGEKSGELMYVFTSNAPPFEPTRSYSKFAAHALLNHGGNFTEAAKDLAAKGYGAQAGHHHANGKPHANGKQHTDAAPPAPSRPLTDIGNAQRFAAEHGAILRHNHPWNKWLVWDGTRWCIDDAGKVKALAKQTVLKLYSEAQIRVKALESGDTHE